MCGNNGSCGCKREKESHHHYHHDHHDHHNHGYECGKLSDSNSYCGSNIPCILSSYRLNRGTKERYIAHYHLKKCYNDQYRNWRHHH